MTRLKKSELFKAISKRFNIPIDELYGIEAMLLEEEKRKRGAMVGEFDQTVRKTGITDFGVKGK